MVINQLQHTFPTKLLQGTRESAHCAKSETNSRKRGCGRECEWLRNQNPSHIPTSKKPQHQESCIHDTTVVPNKYLLSSYYSKSIYMQLQTKESQDPSESTTATVIINPWTRHFWRKIITLFIFTRIAAIHTSSFSFAEASIPSPKEKLFTRREGEKKRKPFFFSPFLFSPHPLCWGKLGNYLDWSHYTLNLQGRY